MFHPVGRKLRECFDRCDVEMFVRVGRVSDVVECDARRSQECCDSFGLDGGVLKEWVSVGRVELNHAVEGPDVWVV